MLVCDCCKKEISPTLGYEVTIATHYACKAWQEKEIDLCLDCKLELQDTRKRAESIFYQNKIIKEA